MQRFDMQSLLSFLISSETRSTTTDSSTNKIGSSANLFGTGRSKLHTSSIVLVVDASSFVDYIFQTNAVALKPQFNGDYDAFDIIVIESLQQLECLGIKLIFVFENSDPTNNSNSNNGSGINSVSSSASRPSLSKTNESSSLKSVDNDSLPIAADCLTCRNLNNAIDLKARWSSLFGFGIAEPGCEKKFWSDFAARTAQTEILGHSSISHYYLAWRVEGYFEKFSEQN